MAEYFPRNTESDLEVISHRGLFRKKRSLTTKTYKLAAKLPLIEGGGVRSGQLKQEEGNEGMVHSEHPILVQRPTRTPRNLLIPNTAETLCGWQTLSACLPITFPPDR